MVQCKIPDSVEIFVYVINFNSAAKLEASVYWKQEEVTGRRLIPEGIVIFPSLSDLPGDST